MTAKTMIAAALVAACTAGASSAQDWNGWYLGLSSTTSDATLSPPGYPYDPSVSDTYVGLYAGYNRTLGPNWVVGGEISYGALDVANVNFSTRFADMLQLRGRVGYAVGNTMPYVTLGVAQARLGVVGASLTEETGVSYGIGIEHMLNENFSLRAEYSAAKFDGVLETFYGPGTDVTIDGLTIGAAFHF